MKNIKSFLLVALVGASFTSCNDFLNLEPLNDIVLENFWTDKSDVESVLLGAYSDLEKSDCVQRMIIWGEVRSDNVLEGNGTGEDIRQICRENLLTTNSFCKYNAFYKVINDANTVLHFAPIVAEKDPNFLPDELLAQEAEAITLRCLCYWYLIRAFHDVPYVTQPSIDDEGGHEKFYVPQSSFDVILDSLIYEMETILDVDGNFKKCRAVTKYPTEDANTARITKASACALLADMYLWRGRDEDYRKCIEVCEEVTAIKKSEYQKLKEKDGKNCTVELINGYPLILDAPSQTPGNSYNEIFGTGQSFEALFELPYNNDVKNPFVGDYYQNNRSQDVGQLKAYDIIGKDLPNSVFDQPSDTRYCQNMKDIKGNGASYAITKYAYDEISLSVTGSGTVSTSGSSIRNQVQADFIIYRYTEVLLFEAEAYIMQAKKIAPAGDDSLSQVAAVNVLKDKAFNLIDAVNRRSIVADGVSKVPNLSAPKTLEIIMSYGANTTIGEVETLLFKERRREFLFEGKRWFDLVRMARRDGDQKRLLGFIKPKHGNSTGSAVEIKLKNPYAMYFPLHRDEVRNSQGVLKQNPAYQDEEVNEKASH